MVKHKGIMKKIKDLFWFCTKKIENSVASLKKKDDTSLKTKIIREEGEVFPNQFV